LTVGISRCRRHQRWFCGAWREGADAPARQCFPAVVPKRAALRCPLMWPSRSGRLLACLLWPVACALAQQPRGAPPIDPEVAREVRAVLEGCYVTEGRLDVDGFLRDLRNDDAAVRNHAGAWLHALLLAVDEDSRSGRAPRFFGLLACSQLAHEL